MKKLHIILAAVCCAVLLNGCKKDDSSAFTGQDNYITVFKLKTEDGSLSASVSGDSILIHTVESRILDGATAVVTVSENGKINPDPATVSDWDNKHTFVVTSFNGKQKIYQYVVNKEKVEASKKGNFTLTTQIEVNDFATLGVKVLDGNLTIGAGYGVDPAMPDNPIQSLGVLSSLKEIKGTLTLYNAPQDDMAGFKNLEKVGTITVSESSGCPKTFILPELKSVLGDINFSDYAASVLTVVYLPKLIRVEGNLYFDGFRRLASFSVPELQAVLGTLYLHGNGGMGDITSLLFPKLKTVGDEIDLYQFAGETIDMPMLKQSGGLLLKASPSVKIIDMPTLEQLMGKTSFDQSSGISEINFPKLLYADDLEINGLSNLSKLNMPQLKQAKNLFLGWLARLTNLGSLSALETIEGTLSLQYLTGLTDNFAIPASLTSINELAVANLPGLTELNLKGTGIKGVDITSGGTTPFKLTADDVMEGSLTLSGLFELTGMKEIQGNVTLLCTASNNPMEQLSNTEKVKGNFKLTYTGIQGDVTLPALKEVGGTYIINSNVPVKAPELGAIGGEFSFDLNSSNNIVYELSLPKLKSVGGNFSIYTQKMTTASLTPPVPADALTLEIKMPSLTSINGILKIYRIATNNSARLNNTLTNLDGFSALTSLKGVDIQKQGALLSYKGLKNALGSFTADDWKLISNGYMPSYQNMVEGKHTNQ